jgi:phage gp46-like protein
MPDIQTLWNVTTGDWNLVPGDVQSGDDLESAVLISLFTDRRAEASDVVPDGSNDRRGWWGDSGSLYLIGSRLWLLRRAVWSPPSRRSAHSSRSA